VPVALVHGHSYLVLAHERSANTGNLIWDATGEDVNHQWGKSLAAERLLGDYVRTSLLAGVEYFSVLQPVHDAAIFAALSSVADRVPLAHSCNVAKPWCRRCPKCAYVWISYRAWLPGSVVDAAFGPDNLLDRPENQLWYRQLLGLEAHTPFECVGLVEETRLAFALARARGVEGRAMALLDEVGPVDVDRLRSRYLSVEASDHRIPPALAGPVLAALRTCSDKVLRRRLVDELPGDGPVGGRAVMTSRRATRDDVERLQPLVEAAIVENQRPFLDVDQIRSSQAIMGIDTQLIDDGTYFVVEIDGVLAGCGGWSRRATLYGGDHSAARDSALLDPATQPARVRAMYTHPRLTRRGVGRRILELCEQAAAAEGFTALELMATHSGRPLYEAFGFLAIEEVEDATGGAPVPLTKMRKRI
jgi:GNAT superfamily N-acetyltransferase